MKGLYKGFWIYAAAIPIVVVILDQLSKYGILRLFEKPNNFCEQILKLSEAERSQIYSTLHIEVSPIFDWSLMCNPGISFGLLGGDSQVKRWGLTLLAFAMVFVIMSILKDTKNKIGRLGLALIIGGAIGNGIDRFLYGAVTDFVNVTDMVPFFHYIFNVADSAITCGVIGLIISLYLDWQDEKAKKADG